MSSAYVAFTRSQHESFAVVNVCDVADGAQLETLLALDPDARRDAVLEIVAHRMQTAGFSDARTAHDVAGLPLPLGPPAVKTQAELRGAIGWQ
jgi:hypothetical protein